MFKIFRLVNFVATFGLYFGLRHTNVRTCHQCSKTPTIDMDVRKFVIEARSELHENLKKAACASICASLALFHPALSMAALVPLPAPTSYNQQILDAIPVKTIRGVWRIREIVEDDKEGLKKGRLTFRGFVNEPSKGTVEYISADGQKEGKGYWLLKPGPITGGKIFFSARWKITFKGTGVSVLYRGDVVLDSLETLQAKSNPHLDAHIRGEVLRPIKSKTGSLQEKKIGNFEADLLMVDNDDEKL